MIAYENSGESPVYWVFSAFIFSIIDAISYYDCTNFYFETDYAEDDKQFGRSKENRPLPIVGMGLFMDMDGIPISFSIYPGNRNEQPTMIPLEEKCLRNSICQR